MIAKTTFSCIDSYIRTSCAKCKTASGGAPCAGYE